MGGGRGGHFGGNQHSVAISEMDQREISMIKNKLRGAKVSFQALNNFDVPQLISVVLCQSSSIDSTSYYPEFDPAIG